MWQLIARFIVLLVTLPIHEYAHAYTAVKLGDDTPRNRLTLNPFAHLSLFGSMALLIIGFGWAKPVNVDARNFKNPKRGMALTAIAGPTANVLLALAVLIIYKIIYYSMGTAEYTDAFYQVLRLIVNINLTLAVFNLIPIPPLDGSKVLGFLLPENIYFFVLRYERYVTIALFALLWLGILDKPIIFLSGGLADLLMFITSPIDMFFLRQLDMFFLRQ